MSVFLKFLRNQFCLGYVDEAFGGSIYNLRIDTSRLPKLDFRRAQVWVYIEVYQTPLLQESVQPDDAAYVTRHLFAALGGA